MAAPGARMRLTVEVLPLTAENAFGPYREQALAAFKGRKFALPVQAEDTFEKVWAQIEKRYKTNYLNAQQAAAFTIKKLQDAYDCDLDLGDTVSDIFQGETDHTMRVIKVVPSFVNRNFSVPPTSNLHPGYVQKRLREINDEHSKKRRRIEQLADTPAQAEPSRDQPVPTTESEVSARDDDVNGGANGAYMSIQSRRSQTGGSVVFVQGARTGLDEFPPGVKEESPELGENPTQSLISNGVAAPTSNDPSIRRQTSRPRSRTPSWHVHMQTQARPVEEVPETENDVTEEIPMLEGIIDDDTTLERLLRQDHHGAMLQQSPQRTSLRTTPPTATERKDVYDVPSSPEFLAKLGDSSKVKKTYARSPRSVQKEVDLLNSSRKSTSNGPDGTRNTSQTPLLKKAYAFQTPVTDDIESTPQEEVTARSGKAKVGGLRTPSKNVFFKTSMSARSSSQSNGLEPSLIDSNASVKKTLDPDIQARLDAANQLRLSSPAARLSSDRNSASKTPSVRPVGEASPDAVFKKPALKAKKAPVKKADSSHPSEDAPASSQPVKRGRGRPRIHPPKEPSATGRGRGRINPPKESPATGRGRGRINPPKESPATGRGRGRINPPKEPPATPSGRGRGRPPKKPDSLLATLQKSSKVSKPTPVKTITKPKKQALEKTKLDSKKQAPEKKPKFFLSQENIDNSDDEDLPNGEKTGEYAIVISSAGSSDEYEGESEPLTQEANLPAQSAKASKPPIEASTLEGTHAEDTNTQMPSDALDEDASTDNGEDTVFDDAPEFVEDLETSIQDTLRAENNTPLSTETGKSTTMPWNTEKWGFDNIDRPDGTAEPANEMNEVVLSTAPEPERFPTKTPESETEILHPALENDSGSKSASPALSTRSSPVVSRRPARFLSHSPTPKGSASGSESGESSAASKSPSPRPDGKEIESESDSDSSSNTDTSEDENEEEMGDTEIPDAIEEGPAPSSKASVDGAVMASSPPITDIPASTSLVPSTSQPTQSQSIQRTPIPPPSNYTQPRKTPVPVPSNASQPPRSSQSVSGQAAARRPAARYAGFRSLQEQLADAKTKPVTTQKKAYDPRMLNLSKLAAKGKGKAGVGAALADDDDSSEEESSSSSSDSD